MKTAEEVLNNTLEEKGINVGCVPEHKEAILQAMETYRNGSGALGTHSKEEYMKSSYPDAHSVFRKIDSIDGNNMLWLGLTVSLNRKSVEEPISDEMRDGAVQYGCDRMMMIIMAALSNNLLGQGMLAPLMVMPLAKLSPADRYIVLFYVEGQVDRDAFNQWYRAAFSSDQDIANLEGQLPMEEVNIT